MALCLSIFYLVHLVIGYPVADVEDVPLPPSYMNQQAQWQSQQMNFRQQPQAYSPENYLEAYAEAGNTDPNAVYDQQDESQYPRMAASMEPVGPANDPPLTDGAPAGGAPPAPGSGSGSGPVVGPVSQTTGSSTTSQAGPPDGHVIPVYTPPKKKHTDKEEEPYLTPQWQSDDGIGDGRDPKIVAALEAITADLIGRGKELTTERKWTKQVEAMLELYKEKVANVHAHTEQIREEMKTLLKKKRQIENVEVQNELSQKLRLAQGDLEALDGAMSHVQSKADEFAEKKKKLEQQIEKINSHIHNLQHKQGEEAEAGEKDDEESETPAAAAAAAEEHEGHEGHEKHEHEKEKDVNNEEASKTKTEKTDKAEKEEESEEGTAKKDVATEKNATKADKAEKEEDAEEGTAKKTTAHPEKEEDAEKSEKTTEPKKGDSEDESPKNQTKSSKKSDEAEFRAKISSFKKLKHHKKPLHLADED